MNLHDTSLLLMFFHCYSHYDAYYMYPLNRLLHIFASIVIISVIVIVIIIIMIMLQDTLSGIHPFSPSPFSFSQFARIDSQIHQEKWRQNHD